MEVFVDDRIRVLRLAHLTGAAHVPHAHCGILDVFLSNREKVSL